MKDPDRSSAGQRLSRRLFLRLVAGAGAAAMLAGCGRPQFTGTPTPTRTPRGPATGTPTPAAAAQAATTTPSGTPLPPTTTASPAEAPVAPEDTETPAAPEATETVGTKKPATATTRPTATPFPPGPPSKLGIFIGRNEPRIREMLKTQNVAIVKTLEYDPNFAQEIKQYAPQALLIGRIDLPQVNVNDMNDPKGAAQAFADKLLPIATEPRRLAAFDAWESYNEPVIDNAEQMGRWAAFEAERTRLLAAAGVRSVIGNFSTGTPALELWPQFRPAIEAALAAKGYLGLHEYSAPTMQWGTGQELLNWGVEGSDEGWLTLRYRKVYRSYLQPNHLELPLLLTELGIDGAVGGHPGPKGLGWKDYRGYWEGELGMAPGGAGNYVQQLAWYDAHLMQDKYVLGAAIFAAAAPPGWESFEILDGVEPILRQYLSVH
jgi:hypothetical protein